MADDRKQSTENPNGVDPIEFLRRALAISPEDAEQVREQAAKDADEGPGRGRPGRRRGKRAS